MLRRSYFAAEEPLDAPNIADKLAANADVPAIMAAIGEKYAETGFNLQKTGNKWVFRTAPDLAHALQKHVVQQRRLCRAPRWKRWQSLPITSL